MIKGIIFDLDGTLLNTLPDITNALNYALSVNLLPKITVDETKYFVGSGVKNLILRALKGKDEFYDNVHADYVRYYQENSRKKTTPYCGIVKLLKDLKRLGYKLAVFSNKDHGDTVNVIDYYFNGLFDYVLGKKECNEIKPSPDGVNEILSFFSLNNDEVMYVGDSDIDIMTARNSNLKMIGCLWGFRTKEEIKDAGFLVNNPVDIIKIIQRLDNKMIDGAIILNKRSEITSQEAIIEVKDALFKQGCFVEKIGHAGTLDPLASGLLIVLINGATKLSDYIISLDKEYNCTIRLGVNTDTLDIDGKVLDTHDVDTTNENIDSVLTSFVGKQKQVPPVFSAIKKDGHKLYEYARNGVKVEADARDIEIYSLTRTSDFANNEFSFNTKVSKGTYIRSLCRDIGIRLDTYGIVSKLDRVKTSKFDLNDAYTIDDIRDKKYHVLSLVDLIDFEKVSVDKETASDVLDGKKLDLHIGNSDIIAIINDNKLLGIYEKCESCYKAKVIWN